MALNINTSVESLNNQRNLTSATADLKKAGDRLASGKRINNASDDPAGLAIAAALSANANIDSVAARNVSDGVSISDIADGGLQAASDITSRLQELATQSANGTLSDNQRTALNQEFQSLNSELDRISNTTTFNGQQLLGSSGGSFDLQVGEGGDQNSKITLKTTGVSAQSLGLAGQDISTQAGAQAALDAAKNASQAVAQTRGDIGSVQSRLDIAFNNLKTSEVNQRDAEDRISSADIAEEAANRVKASIKQQGAVGLAAQANSSAANVLKLLS